MSSDPFEDKHARNRVDRRHQIREWAGYVRTHADDDWGAQVNTLVDAQLQSARHYEDERPDMDRIRESIRRRADEEY